ncbi:pirin family protein [Leptospira borgpetersenii]|uniref:pirin family protein n=1 Tax=Leptospira borgpetersenii TaxID=174 RepID=UPI000774927C|nr:pirin family protein [Leptospira borgpetersenii]MBE8364238.1 pirin family protein [Leptospira borgpetersenii serovar Balcanica]MBE8369099.1 pirin family protein [Leptospira borgpetersenii serovar Balcanica]MBE8400813.1 pirin family protein [Leptospira borgpetersenii serovar Tarassovi]MBE8403939.1 pirin family protein [Leptospira borgpetersenii serovar Tarassovi]MBE8407699.1 pirin family protein [Leptospira borgpetersenii serovar Tarassovi]
MKIISAVIKELGDNFRVRRILPSIEARHVGPFVFVDHMGPVPIQTGKELTVRSHPHIGLATITYLYDGVILHRDSIGSEMPIRPYEVNWMTAGSGIAHSERSQLDSQYSILEGIQTWVALPKESEEVSAEFFHLDQKDIPVIEGESWELRLIAGEFLGKRSPVKVYSSLFYADLNVEPGAKGEWNIPGDQESALYVARGSLEIRDQKIQVGQMAVFNSGETIAFSSTEGSRTILMGGVPFPEPRHLWWNFVSTSLERIEKAKLEWKEERFPKVLGETERIPLPEG